jgi:hypothetical protein
MIEALEVNLCARDDGGDAQYKNRSERQKPPAAVPGNHGRLEMCPRAILSGWCFISS